MAPDALVNMAIVSISPQPNPPLALFLHVESQLSP